MGQLEFSAPEKLPVGVGITDFSCGDEIVDRWVRKCSHSARKNNTAVIYVTYCGGEVAGFYTLSTYSVSHEEVTGGWLARNTPEPVPAVLLGMLGVDKKYQGMQLGGRLLRDAYKNAFKIADLAGARALIVEPSTPNAKNFYIHYGLSELKGTNKLGIKL